MAFYRVCNVCGGALDPGEHCDCEEEARKEEERRMKMLRVGRHGQMAFILPREERANEKAVV